MVFMKHSVLDARRLLCPLPVIRTQDAIRQLQNGDHLEVICTDPGAKLDIPTWCRINGHSIISSREQDYEYIIVVEKGADGN